MKKIFYILVSAIVALGAVACENEGLENINPNVGNGEGLSFVATIDAESRVALNGTVNSWELEDKVVINGYTFTCTDKENGIFFCEKDNVRKDLIGKGEFTATYSNKGDGKVDSSAGAKGAVLTATGSFTETDGVVTAEGFNFTLTSALLKFTTTEAVAFTGDGLFNNAAKTYTGTDVYVAINAKDGATLSYAIGSTTCKTVTMDFKAGKVYNLGYVGPKSDWYVWDEGAQKRIDMFDEYGLAVAHITTKNNIKFSNGTDWIGKQYSDATPKDKWYIGSDYNSQINISNNGTLHVYFDTTAKKWYLSDKNEVPTFLSVIGSINSSNWDKDFAMTWENGYYVATVSAVANNEFKIRHCNDWGTSHGHGNWIEAGSTLVSASSGNFKIKAAGNYKISVKQDLSKIKIEKL